MFPRAALALAAALLLAPGAAPLAADATPGQRAYMEGLRAYELADYAGAAAKLRIALREDPSEGLGKFRFEGLNREDYLPHLYVGLSLEKLGQPREALEALRESERQGAVRGRQGAQRILASALARLAAALPTPAAAPPTPVAPPVAAPPAAEEARTVPAASPGVAVPAAQATAVARSAASAPSKAAGPAPGATAGPTHERMEALRDGIRAFLRGEYGPAARRLEALAPEFPRARAFLALSLAGSYVLGGAKDRELLERSRAEMRAARAAGVTLPQANLLPPTLLTLADGV